MYLLHTHTKLLSPKSLLWQGLEADARLKRTETEATAVAVSLIVALSLVQCEFKVQTMSSQLIKCLKKYIG